MVLCAPRKLTAAQGTEDPHSALNVVVEEIAGNRPNIFLCDVEDIKSMGDAIMSALDYGDRSEIGYLHKESNIEKEVFGFE